MPGCLPPVLVGEGRVTPLPTPPLVFRISLRAVRRPTGFRAEPVEQNSVFRKNPLWQVATPAWAARGGGSGEAQPDRRSQGHLTEFACNGPVRAARPQPLPPSRGSWSCSLYKNHGF